MEPSDAGYETEGGGRSSGPEARIGEVLSGKWRLDAVLGVGGTATVYAATHRFGRRAAIKLLHRPLSNDDATRQRFMREGLVANRVAHPGAVAVLDVDVAADGSAFLVMELLDGETLDQRWDRCGPPSLEEVLETTDRLLGVLVAAHGVGVVHRDLKPENVHLGRDGRLKVLDFGIARLDGSLEQTRTGAVMGTPAFMSPEQTRGGAVAVDARSDLWSVGALMFALLSGRHVHERDSQVDILIAAASQPARSIGELVSLPVEVERIVDRALAFAPEDRFQDALSMQRAVRHALATVRCAHGATLDALAFAPTDERSAWSEGAAAACGRDADLGARAPAAALGALAGPRGSTPPPRSAASVMRPSALPPPQSSAWTLALAGGGAALATVLKGAVLALLLLHVGAGCGAQASARSTSSQSLVAAR